MKNGKFFWSGCTNMGFFMLFSALSVLPAMSAFQFRAHAARKVRGRVVLRS